MIKKIILPLLTITLMLSPAYSYTDSFAQMQSDPLFLELLDAVKNGRSEDEAEAACSAYIASETNPVYLSRMEYHMVRYYMDMGNREMAEKHLEAELKYLEAIPESASEVEKLAAEVDATSSEYYVTKKLGKGMENNNLVKRMYKEFPDEFYAAIQEGFRMLYAPPIAGGSGKKALSIFSSVEENQEGISYLDHYSMLVGKAMALSRTGSYDESDAYLDEAEKIFTFDEAIGETRRDNVKGRRK